MAKDHSSDIAAWKKRLDGAQSYRKKWGYHDDWAENKNAYRHRFPEECRFPFNLIQSMARAMIPNLYFRNPYVNVTPTYQPQLYWHAKLLEGIDNYLIRQLDLKHTMKSTILDTYLCGVGWGKLGYDSFYGLREEDVGVDGAANGETHSDKKGDRIEYNTKIQPGMPWNVRISPEAVLVPYGVKTLTDCEWIAHTVIRPLEDVLKDPKYTNKTDLEGTRIEVLKKSNMYDMLTKASNERALVELVEIRDFKRKQILVMASGHPLFLREPEDDVLQIGGLPFTCLSWSEDPDYIWGLPDASLIMPQQREMNEVRVQMQKHRQIQRLRLLVDKGVISETEIEKMEDSDVGAILRGQNVSASSVVQIQHPIPGDLAAYFNIIAGDVRELLGFSRVQMGEFEPTGRRTKGEAMLVQQANQVRLDEKRDAVADFLVDTIKKLNQIVFSFWTTPQVVKMVGQDGFVYWVQYTASAITGDYNLKVDVESMTPATKAMRKQEMVELLTLASKNPNANLDYLFKLLAKEYDWADISELFPSAGGGAVPFDQFQKQQAGMNPQQVQARRQQSMPVAQGRISASV